MCRSGEIESRTLIGLFEMYLNQLEQYDPKQQQSKAVQT